MSGADPVLGAPQVAGYRVVRLVGQGSMGAVYEAQQLSTDRRVALKWLPATSRSVQQERFQREIRAAARLKHPNVVTVYEGGTTPAGSFLSMELVEGMSFADALEAKVLGRSTAVAVLARVAAALHAVHEAGIVHRDVKPANVVLDAQGEPKLVDFGLAREDGATPLTGKHDLLGTIAYLAPELVRDGPGAAGPPVDVFAVGVMLFEVLAGEHPFLDENAPATLGRLAEGRFRPLPAGEKGPLARACLGALAVDPARRPSASELAAVLAAGNGRRAGRGVVAVAAGALAVTAIGSWALLPPPPTPPAQEPPPVVIAAATTVTPTARVATPTEASLVAPEGDTPAEWLAELRRAAVLDDRPRQRALAERALALPDLDPRTRADFLAALGRVLLFEPERAETAELRLAEALALEPDDEVTLVYACAASALLGQRADAEARAARLRRGGVRKAASVILAAMDRPVQVDFAGLRSTRLADDGPLLEGILRELDRRRPPR